MDNSEQKPTVNSQITGVPMDDLIGGPLRAVTEANRILDFKIRKSVKEDLSKILVIYEKARLFMAQHGNATQWGNSYPSKELIEADIEAGKSYVCLEDERIVATFYFAVEDEPTYAKIKGSWLNDLPYGVIHRIASDGITKGAGTFCIIWAFSQINNIKIDTHNDNKPMQNLLTKLGFVRCGIINVEDGSERIAFQRYSQFLVRI